MAYLNEFLQGQRPRSSGSTQVLPSETLSSEQIEVLVCTNHQLTRDHLRGGMAVKNQECPATAHDRQIQHR